MGRKRPPSYIHQPGDQPKEGGSRFEIVFACRDQLETVKVEKVDMDGWVVYECYFQEQDLIAYLSPDENDTALLHLTLHDEIPEELVRLVQAAILDREA